MVGLLTFGKKIYESIDDVMRNTIGPLHDNLQKMLPLIDEDSEAFTEYVVCDKHYFHSNSISCLIPILHSTGGFKTTSENRRRKTNVQKKSLPKIFFWISLSLCSRKDKMEAGIRYAVSVPLSLMRRGDSCWPHLLTLATHGNIQTMCDLQVSFQLITHSFRIH